MMRYLLFLPLVALLSSCSVDIKAIAGTSVEERYERPLMIFFHDDKTEDFNAKMQDRMRLSFEEGQEVTFANVKKEIETEIPTSVQAVVTDLAEKHNGEVMFFIMPYKLTMYGKRVGSIVYQVTAIDLSNYEELWMGEVTIKGGRLATPRRRAAEAMVNLFTFRKLM